MTDYGLLLSIRNLLSDIRHLFPGQPFDFHGVLVVEGKSPFYN